MPIGALARPLNHVRTLFSQSLRTRVGAFRELRRLELQQRVWGRHYPTFAAFLIGEHLASTAAYVAFCSVEDQHGPAALDAIGVYGAQKVNPLEPPLALAVVVAAIRQARQRRKALTGPAVRALIDETSMLLAPPTTQQPPPPAHASFNTHGAQFYKNEADRVLADLAMEVARAVAAGHGDCAHRHVIAMVPVITSKVRRC